MNDTIPNFDASGENGRVAETNNGGGFVCSKELVERIITERPKLHLLTQELAKKLNSNTGLSLEPGAVDWGVPENVLRYIAAQIHEEDETIETGSGLTTLLMVILAKHHTCVTIDPNGAEKVHAFMDANNIPRSKLTMIVEPSDVALPKLPADLMFDFAFIDGGHGYPIPALDWHYIDLHLRVGGRMGFDNIEIPPVHDHCSFLKRNGTYKFVKTFLYPAWANYGASFWVKLQDQDRGDLAQKDWKRRVTRHNFMDSMKTFIANVTGKRFGVWPWG